MIFGPNFNDKRFQRYPTETLFTVQITSFAYFSARFQWMMDDPEIVSDVLFAIANVISFARTTYLMPAFEVLGHSRYLWAA